jgi:hypothetical protein
MVLAGLIIVLESLIIHNKESEIDKATNEELKIFK